MKTSAYNYQVMYSAYVDGAFHFHLKILNINTNSLMVEDSQINCTEVSTNKHPEALYVSTNAYLIALQARNYQTIAIIKSGNKDVKYVKHIFSAVLGGDFVDDRFIELYSQTGDDNAYTVMLDTEKLTMEVNSYGVVDVKYKLDIVKRYNYKGVGYSVVAHRGVQTRISSIRDNNSTVLREAGRVKLKSFVGVFFAVLEKSAYSTSSEKKAFNNYLEIEWGTSSSQRIFMLDADNIWGYGINIVATLTDNHFTNFWDVSKELKNVLIK